MLRNMDLDHLFECGTKLKVLSGVIPPLTRISTFVTYKGNIVLLCELERKAKGLGSKPRVAGCRKMATLPAGYILQCKVPSATAMILYKYRFCYKQTKSTYMKEN